MAKPAAPWRVKGKRVYRDFSQDELNVQYDARGTAPDGQKYRDFIAENSARVRGELDCRLNVPYGPGDAEILNVFPMPGASM